MGNVRPEIAIEPQIRPTQVKTWLTYEMMSPLGRRLWEIASEVEESDEPELSEEELERELALRRGGASLAGGEHGEQDSDFC